MEVHWRVLVDTFLEVCELRFPRAHGGPIPYGEWTACDDRGVKMSGRNGTVAILFYSLCPGEIMEWSLIPTVAAVYTWNMPQ